MPRILLPVVKAKRNAWNKGRLIGQKRPLLFISGWDGAEDYALVESGDPEPWRAAFAVAAGRQTPPFS